MNARSGLDAIAHGAEKSMKSPRICFYGNFGAGNLGNEATLQAIIEQILRRWPDAQLLCFCTNPEDVRSTPPHRGFSVGSSQSNCRGEVRLKRAPGRPGAALPYCFPEDSSRTGSLDQVPARAQPHRYAHCRRDRNCL